MQKRRLGISLYPERSTFEQDVAYLEKAAKLGFDLLFIALLGAGDRQQTGNISKEKMTLRQSSVLRKVPNTTGSVVMISTCG